jgi:hypothetical protein
MTTTEQITQDKERIAERLARLDADRAKLAEQLADLETAERVLARLGKPPVAGGRQSKAAAPRTAAPTAAKRPSRSPKTTGKKAALSLGDRVLTMIAAAADGMTQAEVNAVCKGVRANHVGVVIARHKRAGRIAESDGRLYAAAMETTAPAGRTAA